jgi:hypothetical protein
MRTKDELLPFCVAVRSAYVKKNCRQCLNDDEHVSTGKDVALSPVQQF